MIFSRQQRRGFTLLELLLGTAMAAVLLVALSQWFTVTIQSQAKTGTIRDIESYGERIMDDITQRLRNAKTVSSPSQGTSGSSLVFTVDNASKSPATFDLSSSQLRFTEGAEMPQVLHPSWIVASQLTITNTAAIGAPPSLRIQFTLARDNPSNVQHFDYQKTFYGSATLRQ